MNSKVTCAPRELDALELPVLDPLANKYTRGKLTLIAGSARYTGAAVLAACAAERMGAGYTEVVTVREAVPLVRAASPSLVVCERAQWQEQWQKQWQEQTKAHLLAPRNIHHPVAVCIGPGMIGAPAVPDADVSFAGGEREEECSLVKQVLTHARCPVLVDGGALSYLAHGQARQALATRAEAGHATVVTPHAGEARRLAEGLALSLRLDDQAYNARLLAETLHAVVVLKGPDTFIADTTEVVAMTEGTPALAKAGTGDVLAGMIASLLAQGAGAFQAAAAGATFHARAGVCAAKCFGSRAVVARDVVECIAPVLAAFDRTNGRATGKANDHANDHAEGKTDDHEDGKADGKEGML